MGQLFAKKMGIKNGRFFGQKVRLKAYIFAKNCTRQIWANFLPKDMGTKNGRILAKK